MPDAAFLKSVCESIPNWFEIDLEELHRLSLAVLGYRDGGWVRKGNIHAIIANTYYGAEATNLPNELLALSVDTARIAKRGGSEFYIKAICYYHWRFGSIHPLRDGNGRTGRTIMAGQLLQSLGYPPALFERKLEARYMDYKYCFRQDDHWVSYSRLLVFISTIIGYKLSSTSVDQSFSLLPLKQTRGGLISPRILRSQANKSDPTGQP